MLRAEPQSHSLPATELVEHVTAPMHHPHATYRSCHGYLCTTVAAPLPCIAGTWFGRRVCGHPATSKLAAFGRTMPQSPVRQHQPIRPMDSAGEHGAVEANDSAFVGVGEGHAGGNGRKQVEDCCSRVPVPSPRTSVHIMASGSSSAGGGEPQGLCSAAMPMRSGVLSSETQSNKSDEFRSMESPESDSSLGHSDLSCNAKSPQGFG